MIKYRLIFEYKKEEDTVNNRENYLNDLLSGVDSIESDNPILVPQNGKVFSISNVDYEVISSKHSISSENDTIFYDTIVLLENIKVREEIKERKRLADLETLEIQNRIMKDLVKKREEAKKADEKRKGLQYPYYDPFEDPFERKEEIGKYIWDRGKDKSRPSWDILAGKYIKKELF